MWFRFISLVLSMLYAGFVGAGSYFGYEVDDSEQSLLFAGSQTEQKTFFSVFAGDLKYDFFDNGVKTRVKSRFITPTIGYRFGSSISYSIAAGYTWESKQELAVQSKDSNEHGLFAQFAASHWKPDGNHELLLSYSSASEFVWSRYRGKYRLGSRWLLGAELFWMGNEDFDSNGLGMLFEVSSNPISATLKIGVKNTATDTHGAYAGVEFYIPH